MATDEPLGEPYELGAFLPPPESPAWEPPPWPKDCPEPGVYDDLDFATYKAIPAVNASVLKLATPLHQKAWREGRLDADTRARKFGRAFHCKALEPQHFKERFLIATACCEPLKSGARKGQPCGVASTCFDKEAGKWYCKTHAKQHETEEPTDFLSEAESQSLKEMVSQMCDVHPVGNMLHRYGGCEVTMIFERDGLPCKLRMDKWIHSDPLCPQTIVDLKKTRQYHTTEKACQTAIREFGYDVSGAWYLDGVMQLTKAGIIPESDKRTEIAWIFAEDTYPHDIAPWWAGTIMRELGRIKMESLWERYKWCIQTNKWPGGCEDITAIEPADWECRQWGLGG